MDVKLCVIVVLTELQTLILFAKTLTAWLRRQKTVLKFQNTNLKSIAIRINGYITDANTGAKYFTASAISTQRVSDSEFG